jgi:hypothetical protein
MYGFCMVMKDRGDKCSRFNNAFVNWMFLPVLVDLGSTRISSPGTPLATVMSRNVSASDYFQIPLVKCIISRT